MLSARSFIDIKTDILIFRRCVCCPNRYTGDQNETKGIAQKIEQKKLEDIVRDQVVANAGSLFHLFD